MSLFDTLKGAMGSVLGQVGAAALPALMSKVLGAEGLQTILTKLDEAGLGDQARSWLDTSRESLPITADQLRAALGNEHVQQVASALGLPVEKVLEVMAEHLPSVAGQLGELSMVEGGSEQASAEQANEPEQAAAA